jgi:hypothetical protein
MVRNDAQKQDSMRNTCGHSAWHSQSRLDLVGFSFLSTTACHLRRSPHPLERTPFQSPHDTNNRKKRHAENHDGMAWKGHEVSQVSATLTGFNAGIYLPTFLLDCYLSDYKDVTQRVI